MPDPIPAPISTTVVVPPAADVLVIVAHPTLEESRVNRQLKRAARRVGASVEVRDLYAMYPDFLIDVGAEQAALTRAKLIVWQHPIHWYSMPPMMKLWLDDVLAFNWAYGPGGTALKGKDLWLVVSTGGPEESYHPSSFNRYFFEAFLPPYEQTAALCGMRFLHPLLLHGAHRVPDEEIAAHAKVYAERLATWPDWPELMDATLAPASLTCEVPATARPKDQVQGVT